MVYFLIISLGEMVMYMLIFGFFSLYVIKFIDLVFGFVFGWNYWYNWVIIVVVEMVVGFLIMKYWFFNVSGFIWSIVFLVIIVGLNIFLLKVYGELEYWFVGIKVVIVIIFLIVGVLMIVGIMGGSEIGFYNYVVDDGLFYGGIKFIFVIFLIVGFLF